MQIPKFRYHPDPVATGSVVRSQERCVCCDEVRGFIYTGPVFSEEELDNALCPWCIASGHAHERFDAEFTDLASVGDNGAWEHVESFIAEEVAFRTPGFVGWQQERWWTHCADAAAFIGVCGAAELRALGAEALEAIRDDTGLPEGEEWQSFLSALSAKGSPTAYLFRCLYCGRLGGYQDCD